jgi:hypothetical protein
MFEMLKGLEEEEEEDDDDEEEEEEEDDDDEDDDGNSTFSLELECWFKEIYEIYRK